MNTPAHALADAAALLLTVEPSVLRTLDDEDLCGLVVAVEQAGRVVDSLRVAGAAEIAWRSRPELGSAGLSDINGHPRSVHFLERITRVSNAEATRRIRLGSALRAGETLAGETLEPRYAAVAAAVESGSIGVEAASTIVRCLDAAERTATVEEITIAETALVVKAGIEPADCVADLARALRDRLDPDGVLPREEESRIRRGIRLGRERNGVTPISGALAPEAASLLTAVFAEANAPGASPRFLADDDAATGVETVTDEAGNEILTIRDTRTRDQRQHDVLAGVLKAGVRASITAPVEVRSTADVTAVILLKDLEAGSGPAWLDGVTETVSASTVQRLVCDAAFRKIILDNNVNVLAYGRTRYPFTPPQRRAIIIRDGGCVWDNCTAPPAWCDVHHVKEYRARGATGTTDVNNGVLLCETHHHYLHRSRWKLRMINGTPHILAPPEIDTHQKWRPTTKSRVRHLIGVS